MSDPIDDANIVPEEEIIDETEDANVVTDESNVVTEETITEDANVITEESITEDANVITEESNVITEETTTTTPSPVITIVRYELYPKDDPTCYCVGFSIACPRSGRSMYRDTQVPLETANTMTETEVAQEAYTHVKESFDQWMCDVASKPSLLGSQFVPV